MEARIVKGETVSDYFHRLKNSFHEADMQKATIDSIMVAVLIANLQGDGNEGKIKKRVIEDLFRDPKPFSRRSPKVLK